MNDEEKERRSGNERRAQIWGRRKTEIISEDLPVEADKKTLEDMILHLNTVYRFDGEGPLSRTEKFGLITIRALRGHDLAFKRLWAAYNAVEKELKLLKDRRS